MDLRDEHIRLVTNDRHRWRIPLMTLGWLLVGLAPIVGILPGPGGIFVFAAGAVLLLRNSHWCRCRYGRLMRRWPKLRSAIDRVMRRPSAMRRRALIQARPIAPD